VIITTVEAANISFGIPPALILLNMNIGNVVSCPETKNARSNSLKESKNEKGMHLVPPRI